MGGCVASVMLQQGRRTEVPHARCEEYTARLAACKGTFATAVPESISDDASSTYRLTDCDAATHEHLVAESYNNPNFYQTMMELCQKRSNMIGVAHRPVEKVVPETVHDSVTGKDKTMEVTYLGPTQYVTFRDMWTRIDAFGRGLIALGVAPRSIVAIYQESCLEWMLGIYGIWSQDMVATTVYANLGESALAYALHETSSAAVICGGSNASKVVKLMAEGQIPSVPIIHIGAVPSSVDTHHLELYSFDAVLEMGLAEAEAGHHDGTGPKNNDGLALIMYTSGTTGNPKGVMHTHGSLTSGAAMLNYRVRDIVGPYEDGEAYCVYLPLAHIMEFTVMSVFMCRGALIGFGSPRTLTDATARPHGDLTEFKPCALVGVPRIFDTLRKAVESKLPPPGSLKRQVFDAAFEARLQALKEGRDTPYWNEKVFGPIRAALGGRVRMMLAGGGPISKSTHDFTNVVFLPCVGGYGMTETVCVGAIQLAGDFETCVAGVLEPGQELKLLDTEEYKHTDSPEPRGEILMRGPFLFKGYYKQPELTKEVLDEDGWFHTGDVGSITAEGKLRIVGRVKALAKNSLGEYVALENLEALYSTNPLLLPNAVCVLVHPDKSYICAIAITDEHRVVEFAREHKIPGEFPAILDSPAFKTAATKSLADTARKAKAANFEVVRHVHVTTDEWTPENDVLTAAMKLKRRVIDVNYADVISELFVDP